ncbi:ribonuclease BN/unknown domain fusion protein [Roseimaritima multifibrata]|uniref:Uncharacterized protein n=1 Tax=Roseimaritima multifibrata TaxID=1930274 RepID=A0A517MLE0_9BACT|nr:YihY/virulence factor BrkB family protein [Roseimaritima multifibrata]QDS95715.1 ribonuclease BN/unknown domain fusion protein [Roseimaritima multifibrata]
MVLKFLRTILTDFSNDRCMTLAASLAYYTLFALPPLLYLLLMLMTIALSTAFGQVAAEQRASDVLQEQAAELFGDTAAVKQVAEILQSSRDMGGQWWKTLLSFVGIAVGATGVVASLQDAMNRVWRVKPDPARSTILTWLSKRLLSMLMILGLGFLLLASIVVSAALTHFGTKLADFVNLGDTYAVVVNYAMQSLVPLTVFAAIFKFMPGAIVRWRDVLFGSIVTTILFWFGRYGLQWYITNHNPAAHLGSAAASMVVFLVWIYYTSMIFLLGAETTKNISIRFGAGVIPDRHSVAFREVIVGNEHNQRRT